MSDHRTDIDAAFRAHRFLRTLKKIGAAAKTADVWRALVPGLTVSDAPPESAGLSFEDDWARDAESRQRLTTEGFLLTPPVVPQDLVAKIRAGVDTLVSAGLPAGFVFMYDEPYHLYAALARALQPLMGEMALWAEGCWAFWVPPADQGNSRWTAYEPHRDWMGGDAQAVDGHLPTSLVAWTALSDVSTHDSCVYVVPAHADRGYHAGQRPVFGDMFRWQDVRAIPASAGQVLLMSSHLAHWTGRSSQWAHQPRTALSAQFRQASLPFTHAYPIDVTSAFSVEERLVGLLPRIKEATAANYADVARALGVTPRPEAPRY